MSSVKLISYVVILEQTLLFIKKKKKKRDFSDLTLKTFQAENSLSAPKTLNLKGLLLNSNIFDLS